MLGMLVMDGHNGLWNSRVFYRADHRALLGPRVMSLVVAGLAYREVAETGRIRPSPYYDWVVDVMEELFKITLLLRGRTDYLTDRYSERNERATKAINR